MWLWCLQGPDKRETHSLVKQVNSSKETRTKKDTKMYKCSYVYPSLLYFNKHTIHERMLQIQPYELQPYKQQENQDIVKQHKITCHALKENESNLHITRMK